MRTRALWMIVLVVCLLGVVSVVGQTEDLAELHVTKIVLDPPSTIRRGEMVEVYARVMNTGSRTADGFDVRLFYRHEGDAAWNLHLEEIEQVEGVSLPASEQDFLEVRFHLPTTGGAFEGLGVYELRVVADASNLITETDELNNELRTTMTLLDSTLGFPDLQPVSLEYHRVNPGSVDDMEPWTVTTTIRNLGDTAAGQFKVAFLVDGKVFDEQVRFVLNEESEVAVTADLDPRADDMPLASGTHQISVVVDPADEVAEQNEGNNTVTGSLTLQSVELVPVSLAFDKSIVRIDEETKVTVTVRNDGPGTAPKGSIEVAFFADHVRFATDTVDVDLGPGMTTIVPLQGILDPEKVGLTDAPATYEIRVLVDPNDLLHEYDEANNELIRDMTIYPPEVKRPEVHPESLTLAPASPAELGSTNTVTLTSVIKNTGRAAADGMSVAFYYRVKGGVRWTKLDCADGITCGQIALAPGAQKTIVGSFPLQRAGSTLSPGVYEIRIVTDADDVLEELDESNNELATTLTLLASRRPDLAVSINPIQPSGALLKGQTARITLTVTNVGEQASGPTEIAVSYCPLIQTGGNQNTTCTEEGFDTFAVLPDSSMPIPALGIGESTSVEVNVETTLLDPGQYRIQAIVDPRDAVDEQASAGSVAANNDRIQADLLVLGPDLAPIVSSFRTSPSSPIDQRVDGEVRFSATIANQGVIAAGEFLVTFALYRLDGGTLSPVPVQSCEGGALPCRDSAFFSHVTVSGLGAGSQIPVSCALDLAEEDLPPGQYVARIYVDRSTVDDVDVDEGAVAEHNELNNSADLLLTLAGSQVQGPDLVPVAGSFRRDPTSGVIDQSVVESIDFVATIENQGVEAAGRFLVTFALYEVVNGAETPVVTQTCADDPNSECNDLPFFGQVDVSGLGEGRQVPVSCRLDLGLAGLDPGQYRVRLYVDRSLVGDEFPDPGVIDEDDETNNAATLELVVIGDPFDKPDLTPVTGSLQRQPTTAINQAEVDAIDFSVRVANQGVKAADSFVTTFALYQIVSGIEVPVMTQSCEDIGGLDCSDLPFFGQVQVPGLGAGSQIPVTCTLDLSQVDLVPGPYRVRVYVDRSLLTDETLDEGRVPELDETNNVAEIDLDIAGEPTNEGGAPIAGAEFELRYPQIRVHPNEVFVYAQVLNLGSAGPRTVEVEFVVTQQSTGEVLLREIVSNTAPLLPDGGMVYVSRRFLDPAAFGGPLAVGETLKVRATVLTPDGTPDNNVGEREARVRN